MAETIYSTSLPGEDAISDAVIRRLREYGDQIVTNIREELLKRGKLATGELYNSITYEVVNDNGIINLNIYGSEYFEWVDQGRPPGKRPPMQNIQRWVSIRGIKPNTSSGIRPRDTGLLRGQKSLAFLIARKIGLEGIKPTNIMQTTLEDVTDPLTLDISDIVSKAITDIIGNGLEEMIKQVNSNIISITINKS